MIWIDVVEKPILPAEVLSKVGGDDDGSVLLFLGNVRNHNDGRDVSGIHYEGYREMALRVLREIAEEAGERWGIRRIALVHRLGDLVVGDTSVALALSSGHRRESFEASRHIMEELKKRLPVWKHERYADGSTEWAAGMEPSR